MSTIRATLEVNDDGTLHLPLPPELQGQHKIVVTATLEVAPESDEQEARRKQEIISIFQELRASNPFKGIKDPVAWQREMREDRPLPWDE